jgi:hypothetical protein
MEYESVTSTLPDDALRTVHAELIRKVYEVDPLVRPRCGGRMKMVAFLTEPAVVADPLRNFSRQPSYLR